MTFKYTYTDSARPTSQHNFGVSESTVLVNSFVVFAKETCCVHKASIFCLLRLALLLRCSIEGSRRWAQKGGPVSCSPLLRRCLSHLSTKRRRRRRRSRKKERKATRRPSYPPDVWSTGHHKNDDRFACQTTSFNFTTLFFPVASFYFIIAL